MRSLVLPCGLLMAGQKVAIKHQGSPELLSISFGVRGSVHLAVSEETQHNTSPVTEGERGGQLAKGNTVQGLSHLFFLCHSKTFFCTANDVSLHTASYIPSVFHSE